MTVATKFNKSILRRLKELERRRAWLVDKSGLSRGYVYDAIKYNSKWSLESAHKIANALGLTIDEMITGEWEK